ncbi:hypothetical protein GOV13_01365 [Candidatus Pacearchaeota archaeon]|nr:hypothetical protein [Candidatus Pacearchaeota archaeon]
MQSSTKFLMWIGFFLIVFFSIFLLPESKTIFIVWLVATIISFMNIFFQLIYLSKKDPEGMKPKKIGGPTETDFKPYAWKIKKTLVIGISVGVILFALIYFFVPEKFNLSYSISRIIYGIIFLYVLFSLFPGMRESW